MPFRRNVCYLPAGETPIRPLIDRLSFFNDKERWGQPFRRGHCEIAVDDLSLIATTMGVDSDPTRGKADG